MKLYWPKAKISKQDLIDYYSSISKIIIPHLKGRPLSLKRYPHGIGSKLVFFQKDVHVKEEKEFMHFKTVHSKTVDKDVHYILADNKETLFYLSNIGTLEIHPWSSRVGSLEKPDYMIFDLDPGDEVPFENVIQVALFMKKYFEKRKVECFVKTSGKRGLHIYIPISPHPFDTVRDLAHQIAGEIVQTLPEIASLKVHPKDRRDKVYIDYLRNAFGQTAIAPYSTRATEEATVSTPLFWKEVNKKLDQKKFTVKTIPGRLKKLGDPWKNILKKKVDLKKLMLDGKIF